MATCDIDALTADAVANRFAGLSWRDLRVVELALWYSLSNSTQTIKQLQASACANGLGCVRGRALLAAKAQMLCNLSDGLRDISNCVNVIPAGSFYDVSGVFDLTGMLQVGTTYLYTGGANETALFNGNNVQVPNGTTFVAVDGAALTGSNGSIPVTATICEV